MKDSTEAPTEVPAKASAEAPAKAPAKARSERIKQLERDGLKFKLRSKLKDASMGRLGKPSKAWLETLEEKAKGRRERAKKRFDAEDAEEDSAQKDQSFDDMQARMELKKAELGRYAWDFVEWSWEAFRPYLSLSPKSTAAFRARFMMPNDEWVKKGFLDVMVVVMHGVVFGFVTDALGGMEENLESNGGKLTCNKHNRLAVLPGASKRLSSDDENTTVDNFKMDKVPFLQLPWWNLNRLHRDFVLEGVRTEADFKRVWPDTMKARLRLVTEVAEEEETVKANLSSWRVEQQEEDAKRVKDSKLMQDEGLEGLVTSAAAPS